MGKETIDTRTYGRSRGRTGNYNTNWQIIGRELMTPDEVRMLDNRYALLFIRGELPIRDEKYDILKHPNLSRTTDGDAAPYLHGTDNLSFATFLVHKLEDTKADGECPNFVFLSSDEINEYLENHEEEKPNEKSNKFS